jgi:hypothetical protein
VARKVALVARFLWLHQQRQVDMVAAVCLVRQVVLVVILQVAAVAVARLDMMVARVVAPRVPVAAAVVVH